MTSIVKLVNEAEDKYGDIRSAPLNCIEFQRARVAIGIDPIAKERSIKDLNQLQDYADRGYTLSETADAIHVSKDKVIIMARMHAIKFHKPYRFVAYEPNNVYYSSSYRALCRKVKPYKIKATFKRFKDLLTGDIYYENRRWRVK